MCQATSKNVTNGYITQHRPFCLHAKYHYINLGHMVVMIIWNVDAQKGKVTFLAEFCYIMSVSNKLSYLLVSIMMLSQDKVSIIFTAKFKIDNMTFTIKRQPWRSIKLKHGLNYTVRLCSRYMYILWFLFWQIILPFKGSCCIHSSEISASYDICLVRYRIWNLMLTM